MIVVVAMVALLAGAALALVADRVRRVRRAPPAALVPAAPAPTGQRDRQLSAIVLESLTEGVVVVDRGDQVLLANAAARSLGALQNDRLATTELRALAHIALDSFGPRQTTLDLPRGWLGRDTGPVSVTAVPLRLQSAARAEVVALLMSDMTEGRRLEAVRRDFVANVSHELKTPVGALILLAEAVQEAADDPDAVARFAGRMQHEGQRLGRLVGELIALSRVQGADALPDLQPVSVEVLIDEAIDRTRMAAERVGITLTASVEPGLSVLGNAEQLATAMVNLVDNAVSYSPDGTRVVLSGRTVSDINGDGRPGVELAVTDQGIGIAEADLDRIFERFYRVDPARSRATGGTGLGLAIVKHVVTNHGGSVTAWSSEGAGSTFTIRLPCVAPVPAPDHSSVPSELRPEHWPPDSWPKPSRPDYGRPAYIRQEHSRPEHSRPETVPPDHPSIATNGTR